MGSFWSFQAPTFFGSKNSFTMFHRLVDPFNPAQAQRVVTPLVTRCAAAHPRFVRETGQARLPRFRWTCGLEMFGVSRVLDNNPRGQDGSHLDVRNILSLQDDSEKLEKKRLVHYNSSPWPKILSPSHPTKIHKPRNSRKNSRHKSEPTWFFSLENPKES